MTISKLDQASYARCPALQHIAAHNDRIAATAQAKLAAEQAAKEARVERSAAAREKRAQERQAAAEAAALAAAKQAKAKADEQRIQDAIRAMARDYIKRHQRIKE